MYEQENKCTQKDTKLIKTSIDPTTESNLKDKSLVRIPKLNQDKRSNKIMDLFI